MSLTWVRELTHWLEARDISVPGPGDALMNRVPAVLSHRYRPRAQASSHAPWQQVQSGDDEAAYKVKEHLMIPIKIQDKSFPADLHQTDRPN